MDISSALSRVSSFTEMLSICRGFSSEISLWGDRYVYVINYKGTLPVARLVTRVKELLKANFEYNETERNSGKQIAKLIDQVYLETDEKLQKVNIFTRILCALKENLLDSMSTSRWAWEKDDENMTFEYYTKRQYCDTFKSPPPTSGDLMITGYPDRWLSPQMVAKFRESKQSQ